MVRDSRCPRTLGVRWLCEGRKRSGILSCNPRLSALKAWERVKSQGTSPRPPRFADPKVKEAGGREGAQLLTSTAAGTGWHPSSCVVGPGEKHTALLGETSSFQSEYPGNREKQAFLCKKEQTLQGMGMLSITARKPGISQCSLTWCSFTS